MKLLELLSEKGYRSVTNWLVQPMHKPYEKNQEKAQKLAAECIDAIAGCDLFVLLSDEGGTGMYVELGAALGNRKSTGRPDIYVIGEWGANSVFTYHPDITVVASEAELLSAL